MLTRRSMVQLLALAPAWPALAGPGAPQPASTATGFNQLRDLAARHMLPIEQVADGFAGAGWDLIVREGLEAQFFLLGEEHGIAGVPELATAIFTALRPAGFDTVVIETSPFMAQALDRAARSGVKGLRAFIDRYPPGPPFYGWTQEARFLAAARAAVAGSADMFWGIDYEIWWQDRFLLDKLRGRVPDAAQPAFRRLERASADAWREFERSRDLLKLFLISGDPSLIAALKESWTNPDAVSTGVMDTLAETVAINSLFASRQVYASNQRRAALMRRNLAARLRAALADGRSPKALVKMGLEHMTRGVNDVGGFDVGSLLPEYALVRGGRTFSLMVIGEGEHAVFDAKTLSSRAQPLDDPAELGLAGLTGAIKQPRMRILDLRPLRQLVVGADLPASVNRYVQGFDALLLWRGCRASSELVRI